MAETMASAPTSAPGPRGTPFLELRGLSKVLGAKPVLRGLDLAVRRGETMAVLGASGSGKSVMLRHLVGLMQPDAGRIVVDGVDVTDFSDREFMAVRAKVAFIFQGGALFDSLTVGENIAFGLREQGRLAGAEIESRIGRALARVGLDGIEDVLPAELSGGMRKRVALARSIALEPECLLYDEPTAGLDPVTGFRVSELIRRNARDSRVTSIVVTHDLPSAWYVADRIAFLKDGRIAFVGTPAEADRSSEPGLREFLDAYRSPA